MRSRRHSEHHRTDRIGWLRAAVLGANDGIVSTASLVIGVAAAHSPRGSVLVAGLVAGAMSMAAGEYVSVHSQSDAEKADLDKERKELAVAPEGALIAAVAGTSLLVLVALGVVAARTSGANASVSARRVVFWGALAMAVTAGVGMVT